MIDINGNKYYTAREVAEKLGKHLKTIHSWVKSGKLKPLKFGPKKFFYDEKSIEDCIRGV